MVAPTAGIGPQATLRPPDNLAVGVDAPVWKPHPGQQTRFLSSPADEALFGGQAGPGKTDCLLMEALRQIHIPEYRAILFRRTFTRLEAADGLVDRSLRWFSGVPGAVYNHAKHFWTFPDANDNPGARIYFAHLQKEESKQQYQGAQYQYIAFDELTEFTLTQYLYLFSRCRTTVDSGLRCYVRSATNPGGVGHEWVKQRFVTRDILNRVRWFARVDEEDVAVNGSEPFEHKGEQIIPRSRAFYPANRGDNPSLDTAYVAQLQALSDDVERKRLMSGDWDAAYSEGVIYPNFGAKNINREIARYRPDLPVYWGVDDGYARGNGRGDVAYHPRTIGFFQDAPGGGLFKFDEYVVTGESITATLDHLLGPKDETARDAPKNNYQRYRKPSVAYVDGAAANLRGEIAKRGIISVNARHLVEEGIKSVRELIGKDDDTCRYWVNPDTCTETIYEYGAYRSAESGRAKVGEIVPEKLNDHCMDGDRYVIHARRHILGMRS